MNPGVGNFWRCAPGGHNLPAIMARLGVTLGWGRGAVVLAWLAVAGHAHADKSPPGPLAYLHTSGNENGDAPSTWGFNAVDGKPTTAWCTTSEPVGQTLILGFARQETLTHISVVVGALSGDGLDKTHARVRELELNDGREKRNITLADQAGPQELTLSPPMAVWKLALVIREVYPGEGKTSACLADVTLRNGPTVVTGDVMARQVRGVPRNKLMLTGPWLDEPSAPERFLTLSLDGTFSWVFEPLMDGERTTIKGEWDLLGNKLQLKPKGAAKAVVMRVERETVAGRKGNIDQLVIDGEGIHEKFSGNYQPNQMRIY
jgi:hypothetical protein